MYVLWAILPKIHEYRSEFFPRKYRLKKDAVAEAKRVIDIGGTARIECPGGGELDFRPDMKRSLLLKRPYK